MRITHITTRVLSTPADNFLVVGLPAPTDTREFVTLELGTDEGLAGLARAVSCWCRTSRDSDWPSIRRRSSATRLAERHA
jgi:hypothetical protein